MKPVGWNAIRLVCVLFSGSLFPVMLYPFERSGTDSFGERPKSWMSWLRHLDIDGGGATVRPKSNQRRPACGKIARVVLFLSAAVTSPLALGAAGDDARDSQKVRAVARLGEELFHREWVAGDARSPGGDGLGPVYNETSCVACHNLGGAGGAGPSNKNVVILSSRPDRWPKRCPQRPAAGQGR